MERSVSGFQSFTQPTGVMRSNGNTKVRDMEAFGLMGLRTQGAASHALWHAWAQLEERSGEPRVVRYLYKKGLEVSVSPGAAKR